MYIFTEFLVLERLHRGPEFCHNYLINYTIGFIIDFITDYTIIALIITTEK
jgi:hypothetical protein